ncbi:Proline-rich spliceosome-associated (PSP) family protein/zinc knuckle (CCHC-type) family protein [Forsythia ovata]|uniref:Proline-rich spliceosome-associated (PSP) family protein/zinc knuckle (CCHC-type) family protein n=1 Tax=Forsythia ovata TaxID=205694 RepID=A0ABD1UD31_9LAMI
METEDFINLPASSISRSGSENNELHEPGEVDSSDGVHDKTSDGVHEKKGTSMETDGEKDGFRSTSTLPVSFELTEGAAASEKITCISSVAHAENGLLAVEDEISLTNNKRDETLVSNREIDASPMSGVKRPRLSDDEKQASVRVIYNSLSRDSKRKLEELLQQWSRWHAQICSSSYDSNEVLESGEETYFPALCVGVDKPSAVTYWVDNQISNQPRKEFIPLDGNSVPLYDRGYSLALTSADGSSNLDGGLDMLETSRCFNCGSYSHALKECPKPRDNVTINNARKQHKTRRNQHTSSRNLTRYYESSPGGKYDGLRPGVLDSETQKLLGLGELDPPPWFNRMREIGYPPGYLDPDDDDQPSGITIFADEATKEETEEGEILELSVAEPSRKMSVKFPGINAPIPENADERLWAAGSSSYNVSRHGSYRGYNHSSENLSRRHYHQQRWSSDFEDDGPPGVDLGSRPSNHSHRYGGYDSSYSSPSARSSPSIPRSPSYGRSLSDRGRRNTLVQDGSSNYGQYGTAHSSSPR